MTNEDIEAWAKQFAGELTVAGQHVPFDRVLVHHLEMFEALRSKGLTWQAIANLLSSAGAQRRDGSPISHDQLRADIPRLRRKQAARQSGDARSHAAHAAELEAHDRN